MKPTLLILAAGMGSRYGSLKQIEAIGPSGEVIIDYSIYDAIRAGFEKVIFVIRRNIEQEFKEVFGTKLKGKVETGYAYQEMDMVPEGIHYPSDRVKPWGTSHAIWVARDSIRGPFVAINADDFYGAQSYRMMADYLSSGEIHSASRYCMMGYRIGQTLSDFGSVSRALCETEDGKFLSSVVERTEITREGDRIVFINNRGQRETLREDVLVSMNIWGFTPEVFPHLELAFKEFLRTQAGNIKSETFIPTVVNDLVTQGKARVRILPATDQWFGVTYKEDKDLAVARINRLIERGIYPSNLWG